MRISRMLLESAALGLLFALIIPAMALAQVASGVATGVAAPTLTDVLTQALGVVSTWQAAGWMAGAIAIVNVLTNLTKLDFIDKWLGKWWWLRPVLAVILGIAAGVFAGLVGGQPAGLAIIIALTSGLSSTGFHELITGVFNNRVQAERAAGARIQTLVATAGGAGSAAVAAMSEDLAEISAIPDKSARVAALAGWGNANPPKPNSVNPSTPTLVGGT